MKLSQKFKKFISATAAAALFVTSFPAFYHYEDAAAADSVSIDTKTTYQTIKGFGGINLPEWAGSDMTSAQVKKAFGNGDDELGLSILRVYVSDDSNAWKTAVPTAKAATALGATIFASPWNPPTNMRESFTKNGQANQRRLAKSSYGAYAKHLNNYVKYMKEQGIDIYSVSIQNEPDYGSEWTWWTSDECLDFIVNYGKDVVAGTDTKLMSPETFQYNKEYYNKILNNPTAFANVDLFGTHFYGTQRSQMDFPALENCGKDIWMTEVYVPNSNANSADNWPEAIQVSENIHNGLVVGNMNAYVWWFIRRNYGPMKDDGTISKRGYCMAQFSKYVRPGDVRIGCTEQPASGVLVSAYKNNSDQVTVVAVNSSTTATTQNFSLKNGEKIEEVDRFRTSGNENIAKTADLEHDTSSFWAQLPAQSVSTFVIQLGDGSGSSSSEQPQTTQPTTDPVTPVIEGGYLFNDSFDSSEGTWTGRGAASVSAADGALSVEGRTSSWNGAVKSLSSTQFSAGKEYSFSVNAKHEGSGTEIFKLTMQYTDGSGTTNYSNVATVEAEGGTWVQLANTNYKIPSDASDLQLYVETEETTTDFMIDDAIAAAAGTVIKSSKGGEGEGGNGPKILGDISRDGSVDVFDVIMGRDSLISGKFGSTIAQKAADVDQNGKFEIADLVLIEKYVLGTQKEWPVPEKQPNKWDDYTETASSDWLNFYKSSIKNMGNTSRLADKLEAAENGEKLTIAYLGGSITEGKNYTSPFSNYVKSTFAKGSFKEINAGLSGTSSVVGLVRSEDEIFSQNPDIVFLEFSVNDHEDIMYKKCFESVIKKALSQPNDPAVVVLINRAKGGFSSQDQMYSIGKNFNIPVISMDDALTKAFNSGFLSTGDYFQDEYHPHANGGKLVSDCLAYFFRQAMKSENRKGEYVFPSSTVYGDEYADCYNAKPSDLTNFNLGSFKQVQGYSSSLSYGLEYQKGSSNTPMTFKTQGKGLIIVFKANSSGMGTALVTVNGKTTKVSGNKQYTWGGPDAELGYYQNTTGELDVSIKMENGSTDFTIWGLGVIR